MHVGQNISVMVSAYLCAKDAHVRDAFVSRVARRPFLATPVAVQSHNVLCCESCCCAEAYSRRPCKSSPVDGRQGGQGQPSVTTQRRRDFGTIMVELRHRVSTWDYMSIWDVILHALRNCSECLRTSIWPSRVGAATHTARDCAAGRSQT